MLQICFTFVPFWSDSENILANSPALVLITNKANTCVHVSGFFVVFICLLGGEFRTNSSHSIYQMSMLSSIVWQTGVVLGNGRITGLLRLI